LAKASPLQGTTLFSGGKPHKETRGQQDWQKDKGKNCYRQSYADGLSDLRGSHKPRHKSNSPKTQQQGEKLKETTRRRGIGLIFHISSLKNSFSFFLSNLKQKSTAKPKITEG